MKLLNDIPQKAQFRKSNKSEFQQLKSIFSYWDNLEKLKENYQNKLMEYLTSPYYKHFNESDLIYEEMIQTKARIRYFEKQSLSFIGLFKSKVFEYRRYMDFLQMKKEQFNNNIDKKHILRFREYSTKEIGVLFKYLRDVFNLDISDSELGRFLDKYVQDKEGKFLNNSKKIISKLKTSEWNHEKELNSIRYKLNHTEMNVN